MRTLKIAFWIGLAWCVVAVAAQEIQPALPTAQDSAPPAAHESLLIGPGDLLRISVIRESELDQRVRVLDSGEIIEVGPPDQIRNSDAVRHAYMGTQRDEVITALAIGEAVAP